TREVPPVADERPAGVRRSPSAASSRAGRRARRGARGDRGSDLGARTITALPAIALALFLVIEGGVVFAVGLLVVGVICMHELYAMYDRAHPARLAGFIALAGLLAAALYGGQFQILLVAVAALPVVFGFTLLNRQPSVGGMAITLLGIYWVGF